MRISLLPGFSYLIIGLFCGFNCLCVYGQLQDSHGFKDSIFYKYRDALNHSVAQRDTSQIINGQLQLAQYFQRAQLYTEAIEYYNSALILTENKAIALKTKLKLAEVYLDLNNYKKALDYLNKVRAAPLIDKDPELEAQALRLIGTCYEKLQQPEKALEFQTQSLGTYEALDDSYGVALVQESIGSIYEDQGKFSLALDYFNKSYTYFTTTKRSDQVHVLNNIGDIYRKTGRLSLALKHTRTALKQALTFQDAHQIQSAHKDLAKTYSLKGNYEIAHNHLIDYINLSEEHFYSQNFEQLNALQTVYDSEAKEAQIALLTEENKTNTARQSSLLISIFALVIIASLLLLYQKRKIKNKQAIEIYRTQLLEAELQNKAIQEQNLQNEIQLKTATLSKYSLTIAQKNKFISDLAANLQNLASRSRIDAPAQLKKLAANLEQHLKNDNEWDDFIQLFEDIHPQFINNLSKIADGKISAAELRLSLLLRLNLTSKEIASILCISPDSVRVARYRLRKKLPINSGEELAHFMLNL